jgi:hypothetical protein
MAKVILPPVAGVLRVVMNGLTQGHPYVNTWHVQYTGNPPDQAVINQIAATQASIYWSNFGLVLNTSTNHKLTQVIDLSSRTAFVGTNSTAHVGQHPGTAVPSVQIACCISWKINARYRGGHPRMYLPAGDNADITGGSLWTSAVQLAYTSNAQAFFNSIEQDATAGLSYNMVCVRYFDQHVLLTDPMVIQIQDGVCRPRIDSMRRRLGKEVG